MTRSYVNEYCTSLDMAGASLTLVKLDDELNELFDAPAEVAVRVLAKSSVAGGDRSAVATPLSCHGSDRLGAGIIDPALIARDRAERPLDYVIRYSPVATSRSAPEDPAASTGNLSRKI